MTRSTASTKGFSLVEVVVALGLLAGVLLSIASLLVLSSRKVNSGRSSSEALSVAGDILEQMEGWGFRQVHSEFNCDGTADSCLVSSLSDPGAAPWQARLTETLGQGRAEIQLDGFDEAGAASALDAARAIRVTVSVFWVEGLRPRSLRLATLRV